MKFTDLDKRMRVFETAHDHCAMPGLYLVARLDGRSFTRLTKDVHKFDAPFDVRFRDLMTTTAAHVMQCGVKALYGYTESDEISILLGPDEGMFGRKLRKLNSVLAGEASARFSLELGAVGCFDCRISQLPRVQDVVDYFRWRSEDAHRNALNSHCYWTLRRNGQTPRQATSALSGRSNAYKNELLFSNGLNFNDVPSWQKRGVGLHWAYHEIEGVDPRTGATTQAARRRLVTDLELPMKAAYGEFIRKFLGDDH